MDSYTLDRALEGFRNNLSSEQKAELESISNGTPKPEDVSELVAKINLRNSERKSRMCADKLRTILDPIQQYCTVVDTFIQSNPTVAALVWGTAKIFVLIAADFTEYFEQLSSMLFQLSPLFPRLQEYEKIFQDSESIQKSISTFYSIVIVIFTQSLKAIQERGIKRMFKSRWRSFKTNFGQLEESLSMAKDEVDAEIKLASEQAVDNSQRQQRVEFMEHRIRYVNETEDNKLRLSEPTVVLVQATPMLVQRHDNHDERRRIRLLAKVKSYDYTWSLRIARTKRCDGTGTWLFEHQKFSEWMNEQLPTFLWLTGFAGCGKTVLTGHVIDHMIKNQGSQQNTNVVYYFFDSRRKDSLPTSRFLDSILHQLLRIKDMTSEMQLRLETIIGVDGERAPSFDELQTLIAHLCCKLDQVFFIIDGVDETEQEERKVVFRFLRRILKDQPKTKFYISSQPEVDIGELCSSRQEIHLKESDVELDIRTLIDCRIDHADCAEFRSMCEPAVIDNLKKALALKAQGIFLWVELQIVEICKACVDSGTADRIPYLLQHLPENLQDIYHIVFQRVLASGHEKSELARKIFQWVMYARRPMTVEELEDAVSVSIDQKFWMEPSAKLRFSNLSRICGNLLSYDESDGVIYLAHHSAAQLLQSCSDFYFRPSSAQSYLGKICVTYLMFGDFEKSLTTATDTRELRSVNHPENPAAFALSGRNDRMFNSEIRLGDSLAHGGRSPECSMEFDAEQRLRSILAVTNRQQHTSFHLLNYCLTNWHQHCSHFTSDDIDGFSAFRQLVVRKDLPLPWLPWDHFGNSESYPHWGMFDWAVRHGNAAILQIWRECVSESIAANSWKRLCAQSGEKLFSAACAAADIAQLNILIKNCVESVAFDNSTNDFVFYALYHAAAFGYFKIVDRIIRTKPDFKIAPDMYRISRAIVAAAAGGHRSVVELLIQKNANVNSAPTGADGRTALQAAAAKGDVNLVELLIERADINAKLAELSGRTALQAAAEGGDLAAVERLIQANADINAPPCKHSGYTALQAAANGGHLAVLERLIRANADINAPPCKYSGRTALQAAAGGGHLEVVQRLIQGKADINAAPCTWYGRTALQAAAQGGHLAIVERLIQEQADINADPCNDSGRTALQAAAQGGHVAVVERLIQEKADINADPCYSSGRTALQAAAQGGHVAVVERLIQEQADINADPCRFSGRTALQAAAKGGHLVVVERLIQEKADINADPCYSSGRTALQFAAEGGHLAVVEQLIQEKANINADLCNSFGRTALQAAAEGGHLAVVERLIQEKADINAVPCYFSGRTALQAAIEGGHVAIVERLIQEKADVNAKPAECYGRTALQAATNHEVLQILSAAGARY